MSQFSQSRPLEPKEWGDGSYMEMTRAIFAWLKVTALFDDNEQQKWLTRLQLNK